MPAGKIVLLATATTILAAPQKQVAFRLLSRVKLIIVNRFFMNRKTAIIIITILLAAVIAGWLYFLLANKTSGPEITPSFSATPIKTNRPAPPNSQIFELISASSFLNPIADKARILLFNPADGFLKSLSLPANPGTETNLIDAKFDGIVSLTWSPNKNFVLAKFLDNGQYRH